MPIGDNLNLKDKLIRRTTRKTSKVSKSSITSKINKPSKRNATADSIKFTFYTKKELLQKLYNFCYWERKPSITDGFNQIVRDGLKGKIVKPIPKQH